MGRFTWDRQMQQYLLAYIMHPLFNLLFILLPTTFAVELPYIRLRDNLDEPSQLGFGIDLQGHGAGVLFTDMQAHSLKPSGGTDMQFNVTENLIRGFGDADGHCVAARHLHVRVSLKFMQKLSILIGG